MKVIYYNNYRNEEGYLETERQFFYNVKGVWFENQNYCDNGKWLMIQQENQVNAIAIQFDEDDEFEILNFGE